MNTSITSPEIQEVLVPSRIRDYLTLQGWNLVGNFGEKASVWEKSDETVILPSDSRFEDYLRRVSELLEIVSKVEKKSLDQLAGEVWARSISPQQQTRFHR